MPLQKTKYDLQYLLGKAAKNDTAIALYQAAQVTDNVTMQLCNATVNNLTEILIVRNSKLQKTVKTFQTNIQSNSEKLPVTCSQNSLQHVYMNGRPLS